MDICPRCGLPKEACVCEGIAKTEQKIIVSIVNRRFGKVATLIEGIDQSANTKEIAKKLKSELACGGTIKNNIIELQGEHRKKAREILQGLGFKAEITG